MTKQQQQQLQAQHQVQFNEIELVIANQNSFNNNEIDRKINKLIHEIWKYGNIRWSQNTYTPPKVSNIRYRTPFNHIVGASINRNEIINTHNPLNGYDTSKTFVDAVLASALLALADDETIISIIHEFVVKFMECSDINVEILTKTQIPFADIFAGFKLTGTEFDENIAREIILFASAIEYILRGTKSCTFDQGTMSIVDIIKNTFMPVQLVGTEITINRILMLKDSKYRMGNKSNGVMDDKFNRPAYKMFNATIIETALLLVLAKPDISEPIIQAIMRLIKFYTALPSDLFVPGIVYGLLPSFRMVMFSVESDYLDSIASIAGFHAQGQYYPYNYPDIYGLCSFRSDGNQYTPRIDVQPELAQIILSKPGLEGFFDVCYNNGLAINLYEQFEDGCDMSKLLVSITENFKSCYLYMASIFKERDNYGLDDVLHELVKITIGFPAFFMPRRNSDAQFCSYKTLTIDNKSAGIEFVDETDFELDSVNPFCYKIVSVSGDLRYIPSHCVSNEVHNPPFMVESVPLMPLNPELVPVLLAEYAEIDAEKARNRELKIEGNDLISFGLGGLPYQVIREYNTDFTGFRLHRIGSDKIEEPVNAEIDEEVIDI